MADERLRDENRLRAARTAQVAEQLVAKAIQQRGATMIVIRVPINKGRLSNPRGSIEYEFA